MVCWNAMLLRKVFKKTMCPEDTNENLNSFFEYFPYHNIAVNFTQCHDLDMLDQNRKYQWEKYLCVICNNIYNESRGC